MGRQPHRLHGILEIQAIVCYFYYGCILSYFKDLRYLADPRDSLEDQEQHYRSEQYQLNNSSFSSKATDPHI